MSHNVFDNSGPEGTMKIGYARTSTIDQVAGLETQERQLRSEGVEKLFSERVSSVAKRVQLETTLDYCREGDVLVVAKLDRLARSTSDLLRINERLTAQGVTLRVIDPNIDTATPAGRLTMTIIGAVAQFEREIMLERQREGIAKAQREGKYKGRAPTARRQADKVIELKKQGKKAEEIAATLAISRASVFRVLKGVAEEHPIS